MRHVKRFGLTREQFAQIALTARANAALNPRALVRRPLSMDEYLSARMISTPLCLYDCDRFTDASTVLIVSAGSAIDEVSRGRQANCARRRAAAQYLRRPDRRRPAARVWLCSRGRRAIARQWWSAPDSRRSACRGVRIRWRPIQPTSADTLPGFRRRFIVTPPP